MNTPASPVIQYYRKKPHVVEALRAVALTYRGGRASDPSNFPRVSNEDLAKFLKEDSGLQAIDAKLTAFNLFCAVNASNQEIRHSNFLAWLFSPTESHGFGDTFLRSFLEGLGTQLEAHNQQPLGKLELGGVRIEREAKQDKLLNRIDLVITLPKAKVVLVVENKLHSLQRKGQLTAYRSTIESAAAFKDYRKIFVLLSLKPEQPEDPQFVPFTYSALVNCFKQAAQQKTDYTLLQAKELFFRHYLDLLGKQEHSFNILRALKADQKELRHSDVLAWLLSPEESHGHGTAFLRDFLLMVQRKAPHGLKPVSAEMCLDDFTVHREFQDIDVLLVSESQRQVIAIENKWGSRESEGQLSRYKAFIHAQFPGFDKSFVFLTVAGDRPHDPDYIPITYADIAPLVAVRHKDLTTTKLTPIQEVAAFADQYFRLVSQQLKAAVKAKIQLPDEIETICMRLIEQKAPYVAALLANVERWQQDLIRGLVPFLYRLADEQFGPKTFKDSSRIQPHVWLRFVPPDFDDIAILSHASSDAELKNKLVQYTFHNIPFGYPDVPYASNAAFEERGILFTLGMARAKSGYEGLREAIYAEARKKIEIFNTATTEKLRGERFSTLIKITLVDGREIVKCDTRDLEQLIATRFRRFVAYQHKEVMNVFRSKAIRDFKVKSN